MSHDVLGYLAHDTLDQILSFSPRCPFSEKEAETAATWQWWSARGAEQRDHLTFLYVLRGGLLPLPPNERASDDAPPWFPAAALPELADYPARPRYVELSTNTLTPVGETIQDWLLACPPEQRPDIVITGSRGHDSRLSRLFLGSVSSHLAQICGVDALLVVRPAAQQAVNSGLAPQVRGRVIALALHPSADTARAQVRWSLKYLLRPSDELKLLTGPAKPGAVKTQHGSHSIAAHVTLNAAAQAILPFLSSGGVRPEVVVLDAGGADVRKEIVRFVNSHAVELVVLGRRAGSAERKSQGSVSAYVLHHSTAAVLIVNELKLHEGL